MSGTTYTVEDWMAELDTINQEVEQGPPGFTARDLREHLRSGGNYRSGGARDLAHRLIQRWIADGVIKYAGQRRCTTIDNRGYWAPVYQPVKKGKRPEA